MRNPTLILLGGFAGAGKTTVAKRLAWDYRFPVLGSDTINDALRDATGKGFHEVSPVAHSMLWQIVRQQLAMGITVVVDTHMCTPRSWELYDALRRQPIGADMWGVRMLPLLLECTLQTHAARIEERGRTDKKHLNLGGDQLEDIMHKYEFIRGLERPDLIRVDANGAIDDVYGSVLGVLRAQGVSGV